MTGTIRCATVFGGNGFIGRYVVRRLAAAGATVIVYGRHARAAGFLKTMGNPGQIILANGDIRDRDAVAGAIAESDTVINLVAILAERRRGDFLALHRDGARLLAESARTAGVTRFIQISAIGADATSDSLYAQSKGLGEKAVLEAFPSATIIRPSIVFGIEDDFFNRFARMAKLSPIIPIIGGKTRFQPVYVDDIAAATIAALSRPEAVGWTYELGGPDVYDFRTLIEMLMNEIGVDRHILDLPLPLADLMARTSAWLPNPPFTQDQVRLLRRDNVVEANAAGLASLDIAATPLRMILPRIAACYRPAGNPGA